ncbi:mechanosensitive ion channel [Gammaproteobacteria bacterium]|nr:mechanosensitive ion channel [Gammaproteobacteria bacterium]
MLFVIAAQLTLSTPVLAQLSSSSVVTDEQVREALARILSEAVHEGETVADPTQAVDGLGIDGMLWRYFADRAHQNVRWVQGHIDQIGPQLLALWRSMTWGGTLSGVLLALAWTVGAFGVGFFSEHVLGRRLRKSHARYSALAIDRVGQRARVVLLIRPFLQALMIALFALPAFALLALIDDANARLRDFLELMVMATVTFRCWRIFARALMAPKSPGLRLLPVSDDTALKATRGLSGFFFVAEFGVNFGFFLMQTGIDPMKVESEMALHQYLVATGGLDVRFSGVYFALIAVALSLLFIFNVSKSRKNINEMFSINLADTLYPHSVPATVRDHSLLRVIWPWLISAWVVMITVMWVPTLLALDIELATRISRIWWVTILALIIDRYFHVLITQVIAMPLLDSPRFRKRVRGVVNVFQFAFRIFLILLALEFVSDVLGYQASSYIGDRFASSLLDVGSMALIAYLLWVLIVAFFDKRLPDEPSGEVEVEGDGGGAGASRSETLMPLLRSFFIACFVVVVALMMLSRLGVEITPLLAGAGVVGLAIGFGSQKLVQDIISGVFFLADDAFRKGEYIDLGALRGTVEKISIRSMQLRHHLGALQTIPYGEIQTVKNLSRDWVTMKLELRLSYDTDVEQVRKIIKKVGQQMLDHPEYGPNFILPLKSQGVLRVEESALIVRMKFTTKPGQQWVIRREAFRLVKDALSEQGIEFAHREVRVRLPGDVEQKMKNDDMSGNERSLVEREIGAAAGSAAEEAQRHSRYDDDGDSGDDR